MRMRTACPKTNSSFTKCNHEKSQQFAVTLGAKLLALLTQHTFQRHLKGAHKKSRSVVKLQILQDCSSYAQLFQGKRRTKDPSERIRTHSLKDRTTRRTKKNVAVHVVLLARPTGKHCAKSLHPGRAFLRQVEAVVKGTTNRVCQVKQASLMA